MKRRASLIAGLFLATAAGGECQQTPVFDRAAFASDFGLLVRTLRENHPKLQLIRERALFDSVVRAVEVRLPSSDRGASYLALMRVVASLRDGHTAVELASLGLRRYPIEVTLFDDGLYVTRAGGAAIRALGWRLRRVGRVPIDTVVARMDPYLAADNEYGRRQSLTLRFAIHELLQATGAADDRGAWFVGATDSVWLPLPEPGLPAFTHTARDTTKRLPDYLVNRATRFWWKPIGGSIMYAQINSLTRDPAVPFAGQVDSLFGEIETKGVSTLIIDIRNNGGGDGTLAKSLVQRIIRAPLINQRNHLYVITGRATFSAAVILAAALENETNAIFAGEPTGAPANHYGEPARMELPHTKIRFAYSRLYWQNGDPRDARPWIAPSVPVPLRFEDWRSGVDAALETILALNGDPVRPKPKLRVAGAYPTAVTLLSDGCGGTSVQDSRTVIQHAEGGTSISLTHAGNTYDGTVRPDGAFSTAGKALSIGDTTYDINIAGEFTGDGFRAFVTVGVRDPRRSAPCQYTVVWRAQRSAGLNMIPGR
jgi:hypothetical protein